MGADFNFACVLRYGHPLILCGRKLCRPVFAEGCQAGRRVGPNVLRSSQFHILLNSPDEGQEHILNKGKCRVSLEGRDGAQGAG